MISEQTGALARTAGALAKTAMKVFIHVRQH